MPDMALSDHLPVVDRFARGAAGIATVRLPEAAGAGVVEMADPGRPAPPARLLG